MNKQNLLYTGAGTIIEHLDNIIFALYAPILSSYFFNPSNQQEAWLIGMILFSVYFLVRPLGALLFGWIGDKYGRKQALTYSIALMTTATLGIGLAPSYESAGAMSSAILIFLRLLQGLSVGGEYGTAMTFIFEHTAENRKIFYGTILIASTHVGGMIAASMAYSEPENFKKIFLILGIVGLILFIMRANFTKNKTFSELNSPVYSPGKGNSYLRIILLSTALMFSFYTTTIYFNKILLSKFELARKDTYLINFYLLTIWTFVTPLVGYIIDLKKINRLKIMRVGCCISVVLGFPLLSLANTLNNLSIFLLAQIILTFSNILFCAPSPAIICSFFQINKRNTHVALSYALGSSVAAIILPINDIFYNSFEINGIIFISLFFILFGFLSTFSLRYKNEQ